MKLYEALAQSFGAYLRCINGNGSAEWETRHRDRIEQLTREHMPSGSGFDAGTSFDFDASRPNRLVFVAPFHHMDEFGAYSGWTDHKAIVTPDLALRFEIRITGRDRDGFKDYAGDTFAHALNMDVEG